MWGGTLVVGWYPGGGVAPWWWGGTLVVGWHPGDHIQWS